MENRSYFQKYDINIWSHRPALLQQHSYQVLFKILKVQSWKSLQELCKVPFGPAQGFPHCFPGCRTGRCGGAYLVGWGWSTLRNSEDAKTQIPSDFGRDKFAIQICCIWGRRCICKPDFIYLISLRKQSEKCLERSPSHRWDGVSQEGPNPRNQDC